MLLFECSAFGLDLGCKKFTYSIRFSAAPIIATTMQILGNKINKRNIDAFLFLKKYWVTTLRWQEPEPAPITEDIWQLSDRYAQFKGGGNIFQDQLI